jgi:hypothetical protein
MTRELGAMVQTEAGRPPWLEVIDGGAPLLLIAPHGGRAGAAARAILHPKVNDLETAEITREIARRVGAAALINTAMDRNQIDCNRLSQIIRHAPWLLDLIAQQVTAIVERHGQATVLLIHGWNIIEPRIDFGLGLKESGGKLRAAAGAHVSASDGFIHGPVRSLAARLRWANIHATFGLRYPGAAAQNLLQGFTTRHAAAEPPALQRLAGLAADGVLNALQLEMSVALRLPGAFREQAIEAISHTFKAGANGASLAVPSAAIRPPMPIQREMPPVVGRKPAASSAPPSRVGVEFYDPASRLGGMVSFDFGPGAAGGRIMILFDGRQVALFTAEGKAEREGNRISIGALELNAIAGGRLQFRGPGVIVDDGTAYLSVERALASGRLDPRMEVDATLEFSGVAASFAAQLAELDELLNGQSDKHHSSAAGRSSVSGAQRRSRPPLVAPPHASFGHLHGTLSINGVRRNFDANFRLGASFTGLGQQKFVSRRMVWASFGGESSHHAVEARALEIDGECDDRIARVLEEGRWTNCELEHLDIVSASRPQPPKSISTVVRTPSGNLLTVVGQPGTFVMLSRPGPERTRLHTSLGFAEYRLGNLQGAGMFEFSRRVGILSGTDGAGETEPE